ncbi:DUF551 domain-containing protein [Acinetobacter baumannii]
MEWISVENCLPPLGIPLLLYGQLGFDHGPTQFEGQYSENRGFEGMWASASQVTHWMIRPENPEEKN